MLRNSQMTRIRLAALALAVSAFGAPAVQAQAILFSDTFGTASASNYNIFQTTGTGGVNTGSVTFGFNYNSTLGIPQAPNSIGDTSMTGLRVQSDQLANTTSDILGAVSVVTKNVALPSVYTLKVNVWSNFIGGTTINDANGSNGTTAPVVATSVKGATYSSATTNSAAGEGGFMTAAVRDGSTPTYRVYVNGVNQGFSNNNWGIYSAASSSSDATAQNYTNAYYMSLFPSVSAPTAQSTAATTQTGSTLAGVFGFAWHAVTVANDGTNTTWTIDNTLIATVADTAYTVGGPQIALGDLDTNTSASSAANGPTYNFDVFADLVITTPVPEPGTISLLGLAGAGLLIRRRRKA
jgi:PEP-CTERM motif